MPLLLFFLTFFSAPWSSLALVRFHCGSNCGDDQAVNRQQPYRCVAKETVKVDYTGNETAPKPTEFSTSWFVFEDNDGKRRLGVNATWSMPGQRFKLTDQGFVVFLNSYYSEELKYDIEVVSARSKRSLREKFAPDEIVQFTFLLCNDYIVPDDVYFWEIMSKPLYKKGSNLQLLSSDLLIPDCCNEDLKTTDYCTAQADKRFCDDCVATDADCSESSGAYDGHEKENVHSKTKVDLRNVVPVDSSPKTVSIVVLVFGILEAAVALIIGDTLLLINSFDEETSLQDDANGLASKLAQSAAGKIRFNLHERNFADLDPVSWTSDRMHDSRHVVFICTPVGKKKFDCCQQSPGTAVPVLNPYVVGLKLAQAWVRDSPFQSPKRITCVYFEPDHNECVPDCFKDRRRFGNVKKFCLRKDSDRFFKYVTNKSPTRKPDVKPTAPDCSREERVLLAGNAYL